MSYPVRFTATITGSISDLDVLIQNELVPSPGRKVDVRENYSSHGNLVVRFRISGLNGTDFKIVYKCISDGTATSDANNPSPIEESIIKSGFREIKLNIPV